MYFVAAGILKLAFDESASQRESREVCALPHIPTCSKLSCLRAKHLESFLINEYSV